MIALQDKSVLVIGLGASGVAACRLLLQCGARVTAVDGADTAAIQTQARELRAQTVTVRIGSNAPIAGEFDLAVVSPGVPLELPLVQDLRQRNVRLIGELELGYQHTRCLCVAITGTNGKTTTTELVERLVTHAQRKTIACGNIGLPVCDVVERTRELDLLTLEVSSFQLETTQFFRPAIAVLLNLTPDHLDRHPTMADYVNAKSRIFANQQAFDWAIVQSEALAQLRAAGIKIPSKIITFSARDSQADLTLDRGLIISRIEGWVGPLLDLERCRLRGPHNVENLMAALAVGRVLRIPLAEMTEALKDYAPAPHRCEPVVEKGGVRFINDSKATNVDALRQALLSIAPAEPGQPNVWLIAGGKDKGLEYHDVGPLLAQRVKGAFLIGETRDRIRAAWGLFTACTTVDSLLEAVQRAARGAVSGDVVLLSPACSSFDMFRNYQHRGEMFCEAVAGLDLNGTKEGKQPL
jgi:UDP-N-acetylmuramoylalanine--D-glutamate ligase